MHGAGNDYIYVNDLADSIENPNTLSNKISDRHFGIGGDGLVLIKSSKNADFFMRMYNADGSEGKMCGNAIRCVGKYVYDNKLTDKKVVDIETLSGIKTVTLKFEENEVVGAKVSMGKPNLNPKSLPANVEGEEFIDKKIKSNDREYSCTLVSMGNPHCVTFVDSMEDIDLEKMAKDIENSGVFPDGVNFEVVEIINENTFKMRVFERGSGETLACGTGACASAVACIKNGYFNKDQEINAKLIGGDLKITWRSSDDDVILEGPAKTVFTGEIDIK